MNRQIKFRGKMIADGNWIYGYLIEENVIREYITNEANKILKSALVDANTIGQYTGIKDKIGKEIYQGDIIQGELVDGEFDRIVVSWNEDRDFLGWNIEPQWEKTCEVISNIHDNP